MLSNTKSKSSHLLGSGTVSKQTAIQTSTFVSILEAICHVGEQELEARQMAIANILLHLLTTNSGGGEFGCQNETFPNPNHSDLEFRKMKKHLFVGDIVANNMHYIGPGPANCWSSSIL